MIKYLVIQQHGQVLAIEVKGSKIRSVVLNNRYCLWSSEDHDTNGAVLSDNPEPRATFASPIKVCPGFDFRVELTEPIEGLDKLRVIWEGMVGTRVRHKDGWEGVIRKEWGSSTGDWFFSVETPNRTIVVDRIENFEAANKTIEQDERPLPPCGTFNGSTKKDCGKPARYKLTFDDAPTRYVCHDHFRGFRDFITLERHGWPTPLELIEEQLSLVAHVEWVLAVLDRLEPGVTAGDLKAMVPE